MASRQNYCATLDEAELSTLSGLRDLPINTENEEMIASLVAQDHDDEPLIKSGVLAITDTAGDDGWRFAVKKVKTKKDPVTQEEGLEAAHTPDSLANERNNGLAIIPASHSKSSSADGSTLTRAASGGSLTPSSSTAISENKFADPSEVESLRDFDSTAATAGYASNAGEETETEILLPTQVQAPTKITTDASTSINVKRQTKNQARKNRRKAAKLAASTNPVSSSLEAPTVTIKAVHLKSSVEVTDHALEVMVSTETLNDRTADTPEQVPGYGEQDGIKYSGSLKGLILDTESRGHHGPAASISEQSTPMQKVAKAPKAKVTVVPSPKITGGKVGSKFAVLAGGDGTMPGDEKADTASGPAQNRPQVYEEEIEDTADAAEEEAGLVATLPKKKNKKKKANKRGKKGGKQGGKITATAVDTEVPDGEQLFYLALFTIPLALFAAWIFNG